MSLKVDVEKSEKSRSDGNTSFKKGKWVEAIGHYTNAVVYNPSNPIAYSNRAQAFLKLDKFRDAERDCTTCINLEESGKINIKALYRRGLARKGLGKNEEAVKDFEEVLKVDQTNDVVKTELNELRILLKDEEAKRSKPRRPITPPIVPKSSSTISTGASIEEISDPTESINITSATSSLSSQIPGKQKEEIPKSFASLRQARESKKKAFVNGQSVLSKPSEPTDKSLLDDTITPQTISEEASKPKLSNNEASANINGASSSSKIPTSNTASIDPERPNLTTVQKSAPDKKVEKELPDDLDTTSTSIGAGLIFLRYLTNDNDKFNHKLISLYQPRILIQILNNLLEPDHLGLIIKAVYYGLNSDTTQNNQNEMQKQEQEQSQGRIKDILLGLKQTKRWKMNYAMLSRKEKLLGEEIWEKVGGQGQFK
ncbi:uncharacterized protein L201_000541 [Kwoniella dendrophila CBS 6074]|uniref:RNA polymerase II-associated protein 3 n=1 Tax=Kwoniella dendrophila CBS 6074 TaxID=1295534 RepID=A0AAX4JJY5_9TREE